MAPYLGRAGVDLSEKAASRETWTSLKFESASTEKPYYKIDNKGIVRGNDDRVLDDSEHGIWGVFDGVGGSEGAAHAAEFVRDFMHTALLTATRPKSLDKAKMLMHKYSPMHVRRAKITV